MSQRLSGDWYPGEIPDNVVLDPGSHLDTSHSLVLFRSRLPVGLRLGQGSAAYTGTMFDVGPAGRVQVGRFAMLNSVRIICDLAVDIGDFALISWNVVLMDGYRGCHPPRPARPIRIEANVWLGFDTCVLPGVTIGAGAVVGARSVVTSSVPPYTVAAGNPARFVRDLPRPSPQGGSERQVQDDPS
jgi:serine acetyltransferase